MCFSLKVISLLTYHHAVEVAALLGLTQKPVLPSGISHCGGSIINLSICCAAPVSLYPMVPAPPSQFTVVIAGDVGGYLRPVVGSISDNWFVKPFAGICQHRHGVILKTYHFENRPRKASNNLQ